MLLVTTLVFNPSAAGSQSLHSSPLFVPRGLGAASRRTGAGLWRAGRARSSSVRWLQLFRPCVGQLRRPVMIEVHLGKFDPTRLLPCHFECGELPELHENSRANLRTCHLLHVAT